MRRATGFSHRRLQKVAGSLPMVDLRFCLLKVSSVDTVAGTAFVKIQTISYWTDPRLIGWSEDRMLPPALWGPRMWLHNALAGRHAGGGR